MQALTHKHPSRTHEVGRGSKSRNAKLLQMRHNEPWVTLSHLLGLGVPASTCAGSFVLLGPGMAGNLAVVLDHEKEDLWACSNHQCPGRGGKDEPSRMGQDPLMSD